VINFNKTS